MLQNNFAPIAVAASLFSLLTTQIQASEPVFEKDGIRYRPAELTNGVPVVHELNFMDARTDGRTGGSYISGGKASTSGIRIQHTGPIAIMDAAQRIELDQFDTSDGPEVLPYSIYCASSEAELKQGIPERTDIIPMSAISYDGLYNLHFDFEPIVCTGTNTFVVPAATIPNTSTLVPRNLYTTAPSIPGARGFIWAEQASDKFDWLDERSLQDQPTKPMLTYPAQSVSYILLERIPETTTWSDQARTILSIQLNGEKVTLQFSDESKSRSLESSSDGQYWYPVVPIESHQTELTFPCVHGVKLFRIGEL